MAGYTKRLTAAHINAMVSAETVNGLVAGERVNALVSAEKVNALVTGERVNALVNFDGVFNPDRAQTLWQGNQGYEQGNAGDVSVTLNDGFYSVTMARGGYEIGNVLISIVEGVNHARVYLEVGQYEATLQALIAFGSLKFRVTELSSTAWKMTKIKKVG